MNAADIRTEWEGAAPGWARWDATIASWMEPATLAMLAMAGVRTGDRVLDIASGSGNQTVRAAQRAGRQGHVTACDISNTMLQHVQRNARDAGLTNVTTLTGAAEDLELAEASFDAAICRLGIMLFADPAKALRAVRRALRPGGKLAVVVFGTPAANPFLAQAMQILLRHAGKAPPVTGEPGLFSLGSPGVIEQLFTDNGFVDIERRTIDTPLRMASATQALALMQEALGALRGIVSDQPTVVRVTAWAEVGAALKSFETEEGFIGPAEVLLAAGVRPVIDREPQKSST